jgi:hypothetical protein
MVVPTYGEYQSNPASIRHAMLAAMVTYHFADYLAISRDLLVAKIDAELFSACPEFETIKAVCIASKHCVAKSSGLSPSDLYESSGAAFSDGTYYDDGTSHSDAPDVIVVGGPLGQVDIDHALKAAMAEIQRHL